MAALQRVCAPVSRLEFPIRPDGADGPNGKHANNRCSCCTSHLWACGFGVVNVARGPSASTAIHHLFRSTVSMSSARCEDHRYPPPSTTAVRVSSAECAKHRYIPSFTTSSGLRCWFRQRGVRTIGSPHHTPPRLRYSRHVARTIGIHRHTQPLSLSCPTSSAHDRRHPKGRKRTCVIHHRV